ncbi:MAG: DMT family transporter [Planctomycetes bacterium]|nr:DMT family transporter [Planctomycetota bacterium]
MSDITPPAPALPAPTATPAPPRHLLSDYAPILICLVLWGLAPPVVKFLQHEGCDAYSLVFYRTFCTVLATGAWAWRAERPALFAALRRPWKFVVLGLLFVGGLICMMEGIYRTNATLSILMTRAIPLFTIVGSAVFYLDERRLARRRDFMAGFVAAMAGLLGLLAGRMDPNAALGLDAGTLLLLLCVVLWAVYSVLVKGWLAGQHPFISSLLIFAVSAAVSLPLMFRFGDPGWVLRARPLALLLLVLSGPAMMGLAEGLYYVSIRRIGLAPSTASSLAVPFLTALIAWPWLGEAPTAAVAGFGLLLIAGLALIVRARSRLLAADRGEVEPIAGRAGAALPAAGRLAPQDPEIP